MGVPPTSRTARIAAAQAAAAATQPQGESQAALFSPPATPPPAAATSPADRARGAGVQPPAPMSPGSVANVPGIAGATHGDPPRGPQADIRDPEAVLTTEGFETVQRIHLEGKRKVWPARAWYPSSIAHPCDRAMVWRFTRSETQELHGHVLQSIFDQGQELQPIIQRRLEDLGFTVQGEGDRPKQYRVAGTVISGRPDGKLIAYQRRKYMPAPVLEVKSMSSYQFERTHTLADLRQAESVYTRNYYAQGQLYAYLEDVPRGVYVLMDKATGLLRLIPFELDFGYVEELLQRVERLQPLVERRVDPDPIPYDRAICGGCGWRGQCYPPKSFGEGASVLDDPDLLDLLTRRETLAPASKEYADLDKAIKERLRHEGIKFAVAGDYVIDGKLVARRAYTVEAGESVQYRISRRDQAGKEA